MIPNQLPRLQPDQPTPLYYQLEIALRRAIEAGDFPDGRMPTEAELGRHYQVSRLTVRTALRRLEEDGLIERRRARGTFVCREALDKLVRDHDRLSLEEDLRRHGGALAIDVLALEETEAPPFVTEGLQLAPHSRVVRVRRLGRINNEPLWLERRYYPLELGLKLSKEMLVGVSVNRLIQQAQGVRVKSARIRLDAAVATSDEAKQLQVSKGHPLLVSQQVSYDADGRPFQLMRSAFRGDRYAVTLTLPEYVAGNRSVREGDEATTDGPERLAAWQLISV
jgi:GntR family transcriptional regulator